MSGGHGKCVKLGGQIVAVLFGFPLNLEEWHPGATSHGPLHGSPLAAGSGPRQVLPQQAVLRAQPEELWVALQLAPCSPGDLGTRKLTQSDGKGSSSIPQNGQGSGRRPFGLPVKPKKGSPSLRQIVYCLNMGQLKKPSQATIAKHPTWVP